MPRNAGLPPPPVEKRTDSAPYSRRTSSILPGDRVDRLLPGNALPLVLAALADAHERILVAVRVIERADAGQALGAHGTVAHRIVGVALELHHAAVAHVRKNGAVVNARATAGLDDLRLAFDRACGGGGLRLHQAFSGGGFNGGGKPGGGRSLQECSAVEFGEVHTLLLLGSRSGAGLRRVSGGLLPAVRTRAHRPAFTESFAFRHAFKQAKID